MFDPKILEALSVLPPDARDRLLESMNETVEKDLGVPTKLTLIDMRDVKTIASNMDLDFFVSDPERYRVLVDVVTELERDRLMQWLIMGKTLANQCRCKTNVLTVTLSQEVAEQMLEGVHTFDQSWRPYVVSPEPHPLQPESIYSTDDPSHRSRVSHVRATIKRLARKRGITLDQASQMMLREERDLRTLELWLLIVVAMEESGTLSLVEC